MEENLSLFSRRSSSGVPSVEPVIALIVLSPLSQNVLSSNVWTAEWNGSSIRPTQRLTDVFHFCYFDCDFSSIHPSPTHLVWGLSRDTPTALFLQPCPKVFPVQPSVSSWGTRPYRCPTHLASSICGHILCVDFIDGHKIKKSWKKGSRFSLTKMLKKVDKEFYWFL